ncbi:MAG: FKBP-type peptidyl-prolyl cis-trans isomerase [Flavobacteriaceae bacterium]
MNIKHILAITTLFLILFSACSKDEPEVTPFDHLGQATIDDDLLREYLETHFYTPPTGNDNFGILDTIENGETPLINQVITKDIEYGDVDYKIYLLKNTPIGVGEAPLLIDSAYVNYKGQLLNATIFDSNDSYFWANLYGGVIPGWSYALPSYNEGVNTSQIGLPISFNQTGKGVFFLPSGLAYRESARSLIPASSPLIFHIEMAMVKRNDPDRDGILAVYEDLNNDLIVKNDDTDGDETPDFIDFDDDGDKLSTVYEDADPNNDGNPNDALDTDGDNTPNYLDNDDDGDGILTADENSDPNLDGNPDDAKDTDGDDIPDYLDAN